MSIQVKDATGATVTVPTLADVDFATQTTVAAVLAKIISAPATEEKQDTGNASLASIAGEDFATQTTSAAILSALGSPLQAGGSVSVGSSISSLPLPSGAATETTLSALNGKVTAVDTGAVVVSSSALPSGAATAANQTTGNSSLSTIATNTDSSDTTASGTITTQNLVPAGVATAGSAVEISTNGKPTVAVQVTGTYTGALSAQATINGTVWVTLSGLLNVNTGALAATITSGTQGIFQVESAGFAQVRITGLAAMTGTATISLRASGRMALIALDAPIPTGANTIGAVNIASAQTLATVTTLTGTTTLTPGTGATNLGKAEDAVAASGDTGVFILGVRRDVAVASASAAGDYNELSVGQFGDQYISKLGTRKRSYSTAFTIVPAASATDVVEIVGSASTTVEIVRITIGGVQTTAGQVLVNLIRRSTAATAGSSTNQTLVPHQATDAAATAIVKAYTANPTTGTSVGNIRSRRLPLGQSTSVVAPTEFTFGENTKPIFLAGVAQTLCLNLGGATVTGGSLDVEIEFTEV